MDRENSEKRQMANRDEVQSGAGQAKQINKGIERKPKWLLALIPIILIAGGYIIYHRYFADRQSTDDAQIDGHINPVSAKVSGYVISINVEDNQFVKAGTVVVRIDPKDYLIALEKAKADLAAARSLAEAAQTQVPVTTTTTSSQISLAKAIIEQAEGMRAAALKDVETARARLESMQARVRESQAHYKKVIQDLERMKLLVAKDEILRQQYDAAVAAADAARATFEAAQAGVDEATRAIEAGQARVAQADAKIKPGFCI